MCINPPEWEGYGPPPPPYIPMPPPKEDEEEERKKKEKEEKEKKKKKEPEKDRDYSGEWRTSLVPSCAQGRRQLLWTLGRNADMGTSEKQYGSFMGL